MEDKRVYDNIAHAVGRTPMVRLHRVVEGFAGEVYAKLEFLNPTGSVKDRIARYMVEKAAKDGRLQPGSRLSLSGLKPRQHQARQDGEDADSKPELLHLQTLQQEGPPVQI